MKNRLALLAIIVLSCLIAAPEQARATGPASISGRWAGTAFAAAFDLTGDAIPARTFEFDAFGTPLFRSLEGVADTALIALPGQGACSDPAALELEPTGRVTFRGPFGDALYATVSHTPHLCFNPAAPSEVLQLVISGGTGIYAHASGSGTATIHDTVLLASPAGALLMIDSRGEFSLSVSQ